MAEGLRPVANLLQELAQRRVLGILALVHVAAGQLPAPAVRDEPVPPHQQDSVLGVDERGHGGGLQLGHMGFEALAVRQLNIRQEEANPLVVVDDPLAVDEPGTGGIVIGSHRANVPDEPPVSPMIGSRGLTSPPDISVGGRSRTRPRSEDACGPRGVVFRLVGRGLSGSYKADVGGSNPSVPTQNRTCHSCNIDGYG